MPTGQPNVQLSKEAYEEASRFLLPGMFEESELTLAAIGDQLPGAVSKRPTGDQLVWLLVLLRSLLEVRLAIGIAHDTDKSARLLERWEATIKEMEDIADSTDDHARDEFWFKDVEFHAVLCEVQEHPLIAGVFRAFRDRLLRVARPANAQMMKETLVEHRRVFDAVRCQDDARIRATMSEHVNLGIHRWFPTSTIEEVPPSGRNDAELGVEDLVFSGNSVRLSRLLSSAPLEIPGFDRFGNHRFLAVDLYTGSMIDGAGSYDELDDTLTSDYGDDYSFRYQIIETAH